MSPVVGALATYPLKSGAPITWDEAVVEPWGLRGDRRWMVTEPDGTFCSARADRVLLHVRVEEQADGIVLVVPGHPPLAVPFPTDAEVVIGTVWGSAARGRVADDGGLLSTLLGRPVRLLWCDDPRFRPVDPRYGEEGDRVAFADGYPLHLTSTSSLAVLQGWVDESCTGRGGPSPTVTMARLRPNIVVDGAHPWQEQQWGRVRIGDVVLRAARPCGRCVLPNVDLDSLTVGAEPLRSIARHNRLEGRSVFGINLVPELAPRATATLRIGDTVEPLG